VNGDAKVVVGPARPSKCSQLNCEVVHESGITTAAGEVNFARKHRGFLLSSAPLFGRATSLQNWALQNLPFSRSMRRRACELLSRRLRRAGRRRSTSSVERQQSSARFATTHRGAGCRLDDVRFV